MIQTLLAFAAIGLVLELLAWAARRFTETARSQARRRLGLATAIVLGLSGLPFAALAAYIGIFLVLGQPGPEDRILGAGVRYRREIITHPRRIVVHIMEVDLTRGARLVVSPPDASLKREATTATIAIDELKADAIVNANFFYPFRESNPIDYSPRAGEPVQPLGMAIGRGRRYGQTAGDWKTFWSEPGGRVGFGEPPAEADAAVAGLGWLIWRGENAVKTPEEPYPRTALGVDVSRRRLWLVVVDGKQPRYSLGMTLDEISDLLIRLGADDAIQLDGGGSSTLAARDGDGRAVLLNRPCHTKIPGRQRPVANFLGVVFGR
jgi:hypothetical protein